MIAGCVYAVMTMLIVAMLALEGFPRLLELLTDPPKTYDWRRWRKRRAWMHP